jgi:Phosphoesterase family
VQEQVLGPGDQIDASMTTTSHAALKANERLGKWSRPVIFAHRDPVLDPGVRAVPGVEPGELAERGVGGERGVAPPVALLERVEPRGCNVLRRTRREASERAELPGPVLGVHPGRHRRQVPGDVVGAEPRLPAPGGGAHVRRLLRGPSGRGIHRLQQRWICPKHSPWANFSDLPLVPNMCNGMHDCGVATGDSWAKAHLSSCQCWAATHNSLLIVTFDEDSGTPANTIATVLDGPMVAPGEYTQRVDHYSILRTVEDMYALPTIGKAADAAPMREIWTTGTGRYAATVVIGTVGRCRCCGGPR